MRNWISTKSGWHISLIGAALTVLPMFLLYHSITGSFLPAILPQLENDTIYYLTQVQKVLQGHASLGNPYILEYRDAAFPGLKLAVYLSSIPGFLGLSINMVYAVNAVFYSVLTGAVLYALCLRITNRAPAASAVLATVGTASLHNLIIRPAVMQTVYPAFGFFMLALLIVITKPKQASSYIALCIATTLSFYLYPHLWMQTFTAYGLLFLASLLRREAAFARDLLVTGIGIVLLCLPQIITTIHLFTEPMAVLINIRSGLVNTHAVLPLTITNNKYTILIVVALLLLRNRRRFRPDEVLLLLLTSSILIAATSNVVTGKLMDFHTHPLRLGLMVNIIGLAVFWRTVVSASVRIEKWIASFCITLLLLTTVNRVCIRANAYSYIPKRTDIRLLYEKISDYERIVQFLNKNNIHNSPIAAENFLAFMLPLYTDNTTLLVGRANLHVLPQEELLERFLVQNVDHVDRAFLLNHVDYFGGLDYIEEAKYKNAFAEEKDKIQPIDLLGGDAYLDTVLQRHTEINRNYEQYLRKFHIRYIITDKLSDVNPRVPRSASNMYEDKRFAVYAVN